MHSLGIVVLRFRNDEVMRELNAVIEKIVDVIEDLSLHPSPPVHKPYPYGLRFGQLRCANCSFNLWQGEGIAVKNIVSFI
jgi:hypothetical protein